MNTTYEITEERIRYHGANEVREISTVDAEDLFAELEACGVPPRCWNFGPGHGPTLNGRFTRWAEVR